MVALQRLLQPVERRHDRDPGDGGQDAALEVGGARQHPAPPGQSLDPPIFRREGPFRQHRSGNPQPRALQTATLVDELHAQTVALALELTPAARAGAYLRHRHPDLARLVLARGEVPAAVPGRHRERQQVALAHGQERLRDEHLVVFPGLVRHPGAAEAGKTRGRADRDRAGRATRRAACTRFAFSACHDILRGDRARSPDASAGSRREARRLRGSERER